MYWIPVISIFLIGTIVGSFVNVLIYRMPIDQSIWTPRSLCPHCKKTIPWFRNFPIVSFIAQRAKCAECDHSISWQYPIVELINGLGWATSFYMFEPLYALLTALLISVLIALAWIDVKIMMIPLSLIISGIVIIFFTIIFGYLHWAEVLWGALTGVAIPLIMMGITYLLTKRQGMGWGDVQLGFVLGAWLGPWYMMMTLFLAALLGIFVWITVSILNGFDRDRPLPFAPYLVVSATLMLFYGSSVSHLFDRFLLL